jgi:hypothetical protein
MTKKQRINLRVKEFIDKLKCAVVKSKKKAVKPKKVLSPEE